MLESLENKGLSFNQEENEKEKTSGKGNFERARDILEQTPCPEKIQIFKN